MILRTEDLKDVCSKILFAVDSNELSTITETLELKTSNQNLLISVTNREYYAQVKLPIDNDEQLHATVNANLFLKLVAQFTTETIELTISGNSLKVKRNGTYTIPLIFDDDKLLELPEIKINNVTKEFKVSSSILKSILMYNSKQLTQGTISKPVQKLYYMDELGAITFTTGACVNSFSLPEPMKILLNNRIVKLFKLFKDGDVNFQLGYDALTEEIIQTKVNFSTDTISITAIISCDDTLLNSVPTAAIRGRATATYPYSVNISKDELIQTINRLLLFRTNSNGKEVVKLYSTFDFGKDSVTIYDVNKTNKEVIYYSNTTLELDENYVAVLDLLDMKATLDNCVEPYLTINFGNNTAIVIARGNIRNVVPECKVN